jgi:hypothetical protein
VPHSLVRKPTFRNNTNRIAGCRVTCFLSASCLAYFSVLKMEVTCSSETITDLPPATRSYIPKDRIVLNHRCENLKRHTTFHFNSISLYNFLVPQSQNRAKDSGSCCLYVLFPCHSLRTLLISNCYLKLYKPINTGQRAGVPIKTGNRADVRYEVRTSMF